MDTSAIVLFPKGEKAPAAYFTGTAWVKTLVTYGNALHCLIGNVIFEPGTRTTGTAIRADKFSFVRRAPVTIRKMGNPYSYSKEEMSCRFFRM